MQKDPGAGIEPRTFSLQGISATNCATVWPDQGYGNTKRIPLQLEDKLKRHLLFYATHQWHKKSTSPDPAYQTEATTRPAQMRKLEMVCAHFIYKDACNEAATAELLEGHSLSLA